MHNRTLMFSSREAESRLLLRWRTSAVPLASICLSLGAVGCAPVTATYPHCPVPVLLSKVNRVAQSTPAATKPTGLYDVITASAENYASGSSDTRSSSSESRSTGPMTLTVEALALIPNRNDVEASEIQL